MGTRDVDAGRALSCGFSLLPPSPVAILLPAPPVCLTSLREEGYGKCAIFVCCRVTCIFCFLRAVCPTIQYANPTEDTVHSPISDQSPNAQHSALLFLSDPTSALSKYLTPFSTGLNSQCQQRSARLRRLATSQFAASQPQPRCQLGSPKTQNAKSAGGRMNVLPRKKPSMR